MTRLADFEGLWQLRRRIVDRRAGVTGDFRGQARFEPGQGGLILTETGQMHYGTGVPMRAERRYIWREEAGGIAVCFEDDRPFHWFSGTQVEASHDCPPDMYKVRYDFSDWPRWSSRWIVSGPRKDYVMDSHFRK